MSIISQTTWDKFTQEEIKEIQKRFFEVKDTAASADCIMYELFGKENLQPKQLTYEDVAKELFGKNNQSWWTTNQGYISHGKLDSKTKAFLNDNNCTSYEQAEKLLAINQLLNVAKFLNKDWKPDWDKEDKFYLFYQYPNECVQIEPTIVNNFALVYFKSFKLAEMAIQILGEDTVRLALDSNY